MFIQNGSGSLGSLCGRAVNFLSTRKETEQDVLARGWPSKKKGVTVTNECMSTLTLGKAPALRRFLGSFIRPKMVRHNK